LQNHRFYLASAQLGLSNDSIMILHLQGHYNLIAGYAEYPIKPQATEKNYWLFLADQSPFHSESRQEENHWKVSPPVWSIRWGAVREAFKSKPNYGIIKLSRK